MKAALPPRVVDLSSVCLNCFASLFSVFFDFSRDKQYFLLLAECARENLSLEAVCCLKKLGPDRLFFYINKIGVERMLQFTDRALQECIPLWRQHGKKLSRWGFLVSIDMTNIEYYGEEDEYVHNYAKRVGKVFKHILVRRYIALSIIAPRFKMCLCILPVKKGDKLEDLVDQLLDRVKTVRVRCVVMDKEFYNVGVLDRIEARGLHYLVPVVKRTEIGVLYWVCTLTGNWIQKYVMSKGKKSEKQVTIYYKELHLSNYIGFASNRDMKTDTAEKLLHLYDQRWNIENGFKEAEDYRISTTSRNHAYRLLLYVISHLLVNLQNIVRATRYPVRYYEMMKIIKLVLDPGTQRGEHEITKRLTVKL